ncbi:MAG: cell division protein ZapA [Lachnospiraceae bacterium]
MATKKTMEVLIDGKLYTLATEDSGEHVQRIINYFNSKIDEFKKNSNYKRMSKDYQNILLSLNIADDLFKAKGVIGELKEQLIKKDRDIAVLQEKLEELQMKQSMAKEMLGESKKEKKKRNE